MFNATRIVIFLLLTRQNLGAQAQPSIEARTSVIDQCSNEVLKLSLKAVSTPGPLHKPSSPEPVPMWDGLIEVRLQNISSLIVRVEELASDWEYEVSALDASGKPVPMTEYGKKSTPGKVPPGAEYSGPVSSFYLLPSQESAAQRMYISRIYKIEPGEAYTIRLKREAGLPRVDQAGRIVRNPGLTCSLAIPARPLMDLR